jgi:hypothetical protein
VQQHLTVTTAAAKAIKNMSHGRMLSYTSGSTAGAAAAHQAAAAAAAVRKAMAAGVVSRNSSSFGSKQRLSVQLQVLQMPGKLAAACHLMLLRQ